MNSFVETSVALFCFVTMLPISKLDLGAGPMWARARINAARNSVGMVFCCAGCSSDVSFSSGASELSVSAVAVFSSGTGSKNFGRGTVNSGFLVRKMIIVVAMYVGIAAKISIPKTKPGKPRSCA